LELLPPPQAITPKQIARTHNAERPRLARGDVELASTVLGLFGWIIFDSSVRLAFSESRRRRSAWGAVMVVNIEVATSVESAD
jgi:hypothetical protein